MSSSTITTLFSLLMHAGEDAPGGTSERPVATPASAAEADPSRAVLRSQRRCGRLRADPRKEDAAERVCARAEDWQTLEARLAAQTRTFQAVFRDARQARCGTALCFGPANKFAFEPLVELPIGKTVAFPGSGLGRFINGNDVSLSFNAGVRFWVAWDWVSFAVYFSKPILPADQVIHVMGSPYAYPATGVRRPLPGVGLGLFGDILWVGFDYDQLRNGNGDQRDPLFPANSIVSRAFVVSFAIAPITALRTGIGSAVSRARERRDDALRAEAATNPGTEVEPETPEPETPEPETPEPETPEPETPEPETPEPETPETPEPPS